MKAQKNPGFTDKQADRFFEEFCRRLKLKNKAFFIRPDTKHLPVDVAHNKTYSKKNVILRYVSAFNLPENFCSRPDWYCHFDGMFFKRKDIIQNNKNTITAPASALRQFGISFAFYASPRDEEQTQHNAAISKSLIGGALKLAAAIDRDIEK